MYDRRITALAVEEAAKEKDWEPVYHSIGQIEAAIAHFEHLYDPDQKKLKRALTPEEDAFIRNERRLCMLDFRGYWLSRYAWIVDFTKRPVRFVPNISQEIVMDLWAERETRGLAIWMQQLKARRLGVSTISELAVCHRFQFHEYSNCVVASADPTKTLEMAGMIKFCLDNQPWWLLPQGLPKIKSGIPVEYPDIHTSLTFQAGNQFTGVARGSTPSVIHLSELMEWVDAEELVDGALMRAVIDGPNTFGILESTGGGLGTWWHRTWDQNKRDSARGRARVIPVFLPWYVGTDLYPSKADLRARPVPHDWTPSDRSIAHAERARSYVLSNPALFKYVAREDTDWKLSKEQMWFREIEYETAKDKKELHIFHMELCADDFEAFQSSNVPVIDPEILIGYQDRTRDPVGVYTVIGPDIPQSLVIPNRYWDRSQPTITVKTRDILPRYDVSFQLVPLLFEGYANFDEALKLLIWEWPTEGHTYGTGVDTSEGIGQDNAVIEVLREATPRRPPGQVAEWASNTVTAFQLWPIVMAVAALYSTTSPQTGRKTQSKLVIETMSSGSATQNELQKRGWTHFHAWKYNDTRKPRRDIETNRIGVLTNHWFRSAMLDLLLTDLSEESIDLPSPYLVQELLTLERAFDQKKVKAAPDAKDDRVMAIGFPLFSLEMNKPVHKQFQRRRVSYAPGLVEDAGLAHPIWTPPDVAIAKAPIIPQRMYGNRKYGALQRIVNQNMPPGFR